MRPALASLAVMMLVLAAPASASTHTYHATFVEIGGDTGIGSCGSATISGFGHVADQCIVFDACGPNCHERTITFDDGSTLVIHESVVGVISHGKSAGFLEITRISSMARARSKARPAVEPALSISTRVP
jgi:hypothetical protein